MRLWPGATHSEFLMRGRGVETLARPGNELIQSWNREVEKTKTLQVFYWDSIGKQKPCFFCFPWEVKVVITSRFSCFYLNCLGFCQRHVIILISARIFVLLDWSQRFIFWRPWMLKVMESWNKRWLVKFTEFSGLWMICFIISKHWTLAVLTLTLHSNLYKAANSRPFSAWLALVMDAAPRSQPLEPPTIGSVA